MRKWKIAIDLYKNKKVLLGYCASMEEITKEDFIKYLGRNELSIFAFEDKKDLDASLDWIHIETIENQMANAMFNV